MNQMNLLHKPPQGYEMKDPVAIKEFIRAGRAKITLYSSRSSNHYTYKIRTPGASDVSHVTRRTDHTYIYLGTIFSNNKFLATRKTNPVERHSVEFLAFEWFWNILETNRLHPELIVYHEGICCRCGRALTDPTSIKLGWGPECIKHMYRRPPIAEPIT